MSRSHLFLAAASAVVALIAAFVVATAIDARRGGEIVVEHVPAESSIVVWVEGAVKHPGLYRLPAGARLNDAIVAAGGLGPNADPSRFNPAERLTDLQHIVVPALDSPIATPKQSMTPISIVTATDTSVAPVNINIASQDELETLPEIGPALAARIIAYRETNGPFARIEELARVDGISPAMVDRLSSLITVGS